MLQDRNNLQNYISETSSNYNSLDHMELLTIVLVYSTIAYE